MGASEAISMQFCIVYGLEKIWLLFWQAFVQSLYSGVFGTA